MIPHDALVLLLCLVLLVLVLLLLVLSIHFEEAKQTVVVITILKAKEGLDLINDDLFGLNVPPF